MKNFYEILEVDKKASSEIIEKAYKEALRILEENKDGLTQLANKLIDKEVVFGDDLEMIFGKRPWVKEEIDFPKESQQTTDNGQQSSSTSVRFVLEDNYCLDYNFETKAKPVKDSGLTFKEEDLDLSENYESVRVGDVVKSKVDNVLEEEGLNLRKLLIYLL